MAGLLFLSISLFFGCAGGNMQQQPAPLANGGVVVKSESVALDQYGGLMSQSCTNTTGHFILSKINNRWWFCTPDGHVFISMSVGNVVPNSNPTLDCAGNNTYLIYNAKYGDATYNWAWNTLKRITAWGFNSVGQDSTGLVSPTTTCSNCVWPGGKQPIPVPFLMEPKPSEYASINYYGYLNSPVKDEIVGTNGNYTAWRGGALFDAFDPNLKAEWQNELVKAKLLKSNYPYLLGIFTDDSDYFTGFGDGPDFVAGDTNPNLGYITLITSPVQTFNHASWFQKKALLYTSSMVYSKAQATNPAHGTCSISNPCSLRDYLYDKYSGSIAALNNAWGSNYTSFDSSGTQVPGETIGTGNGNQTAFTYTLAHTAVSPYSVLISLGGVPQIGDCPWFHCSAPSNTGVLMSSGSNYLASSTINYSTGAITLNFVTPPPLGTSITISYTYGGWMAGGTGLMDESGSGGWVGTNNYCLEGPDSKFSKYFTCTGAVGYKAKPNANAALAADVDNWVSQFSAQYFKTMHDGLKAVSDIPYLGLDSFGQYTYSKVLQGAAPYVDGGFVGAQNWSQSVPLQPREFQSAYQYFTNYIGDVPLVAISYPVANPDSAYRCNAPGATDLKTQANRGQAWYSTVTYLLTTPGANGTYPFVGFDWWAWHDFQGANQGLVSLHDNAYDGHEDVSGPVACSAPLESLSCGGEQGNYGDAISRVRAATTYWLTMGASGTSAGTPSSTTGSGTPASTSTQPGFTPVTHAQGELH